MNSAKTIEKRPYKAEQYNTLNFKQKWLVFLLALGLLIGSAYTTYVHFDFSHSTDSKSYMKMAQGDFDVTLTHRYRVIVPFLAAGVAWPLQQVYTKVWPHRAQSGWPLRLGFFVVNSLLMAWFGLLLVQICIACGSNLWSAVLAMAAVLASRWAVYSAGLPLIDSLYLVSVALLFYGLKANVKWALVFAVIVGPLAKESFIFFVPLVLFYGRVLSLPQRFAWLAVSGAVAFCVRYIIDSHMQVPETASMQNAVAHVENIVNSLKRMFSVKGVGEILSVFGVFTFILLAALTGGSAARNAWFKPLGLLSFWWLVIIMVHVLLSSDVGRMLYLSAPVFAVAVALIVERHPWFKQIRQLKS